jgi:hypothetical protein
MPWVIAVATVFTTEGGSGEACNQMRTVSTRTLSFDQAGVLRTTVRGMPDDPHGGFDGSTAPDGPDGRSVRSASYSPPKIVHPGPSGEGYQQTQAPLAGRDEGSTATLLGEWAFAADAEGDVLMDAFVRRDGVIGLIVAPSATPEPARGRIQYLVCSMARPSPGRPIELIAYQHEQEMARTICEPPNGLPETVIVR